MRRSFTLIFFLSFSLVVRSQNDTIFTKKGTKLPCKIEEITETEIKYKRDDTQGGPRYIIEKSAVIKYTLANGYSETFNGTEINKDVEKQDDKKSKPDFKKVIGYNGLAVKLQPLGIIFDHFSVSIERVIGKEVNFELEGGYINSSVNPSTATFVKDSKVTFNGLYVKPGLKISFARTAAIMEKSDFHPLKGGYFKAELAYSDISYQGLSREVPNYVNGNSTFTTVSSDLHTTAYGALFSFGYQHVFPAGFTIDFSAGTGVTARKYEFSNPDYLLRTGYGFFRENDIDSYNYYHGFIRMRELPLSFVCALKLGYVLEGNEKQRRN